MPKTSRSEQMDFKGLEIIADEFTGSFNGEITGDITSSQISDASTVGTSVLKAADGAAARTAIGAGTSNLAIGTTASTAAAGNHTHSFTTLLGEVSGATGENLNEILTGLTARIAALEA